MMASLIKKYRRILAALIILLLFAAAPYLVPANPDSAVFRSGSLSLILMLAAYVPVERALSKNSLRALVYGFFWGLLFAFGLSIGSEMIAYDGLLPGMGSLIRRLAVPCMAAPFFGTLASFLFSFEPKPWKERRPIPYGVFFLLIAGCYTLVLLAFFPGVIIYDFEHEIRQFTTGVYEAAHPVFHTLFLGSLYTLGEKLFGSMNAGAALYSAVQLLLLAAMYAWCCTFVQKRLPRAVTLVLAGMFALLPFHGVLAISTAKDPLFSGLCAVLMMTLWELMEDPERFFHSRSALVRFGLVSLLMCLLRHNAIAAVAPCCLAAVLLAKGTRKPAALLMAVTLAASLFAPRALEAAVGASKTPSSEMMSVPCQQLMRTAEYADVSEEEFKEINSWFSDASHRYRPHCADPAKGGNFSFDRYQQSPDAYWSMYKRYGKAYPRVYLEAFLENCAGLWNPDDRSHSNSLGGEEWDFVYLNTTYSYEDGRYDLHPHSLIPRLRRLLYDSTHFSKHQNLPLLAQLFCPATYTYLMLFGTMLCFFRRQKRKALCFLPLWGLWLTLVFSAGIFVRYAYPLMAALPLMTALLLFQKEKA